MGWEQRLWWGDGGDWLGGVAGDYKEYVLKAVESERMPPGLWPGVPACAASVFSCVSCSPASEEPGWLHRGRQKDRTSRNSSRDEVVYWGGLKRQKENENDTKVKCYEMLIPTAD